MIGSFVEISTSFELPLVAVVPPVEHKTPQKKEKLMAGSTNTSDEDEREAHVQHFVVPLLVLSLYGSPARTAGAAAFALLESPSCVFCGRTFCALISFRGIHSALVEFGVSFGVDT